MTRAITERTPYRLDVTPREQPVVGGPGHLELSVLLRDGARVQTFDDLHGQPMHLVAVSCDLEHFQHVHPTLGADGVLSTQLSYTRPTPYALFAEVAPAGDAAGEQVLRHTIWPDGARATSARLDPTTALEGESTLTKLVADTRVSLAALETTIRAGRQVTLRIEVTDLRGAPVELEDWLGMPVHAIAISEDLRQFLHFHGRSASAAGRDHHHHHAAASTRTRESTLLVDATFPEPGLYKLWVQLQSSGQLITAPFVIRVE